MDILKIIDEIKHQVEPIATSQEPWWEKIGKIVEIVTPKIEDAAEGWNGSDKKAVAMQVLNDIWFKYFDVKFIPNFIEKRLVDFVASKTIDAVVAQFNKMGVFKHSS